MRTNTFLCILVSVLSGFPLTAESGPIALKVLSTYPELTDGSLFDESAAETVAYDSGTALLLVTNGKDNTLDVIDMSDPNSISLLAALDLASFGPAPRDVAVSGGLAAVAVEAEVSTDNGVVLLFDVGAASAGQFEPTVLEVGPLPDALTVSPDGETIVVCNEGEPNDEYTVDPEGSVSIIDVASLTVRTAGFIKFNRLERVLKRRGVRIFGPGATVAQDLEPENVSVSPDSRTAFVTLQENNAFAIVDLKHARVKRVVPAGYKFHLAPMNSFDASNKDDMINLQPWPVFGMYHPDGIAAFNAFGKTFFVTANEGDARDYDGYSEEARVKDLQLSPVYEQYWPGIQEDENLGRLKTTTAPPFGKYIDENGLEIYTEIYAYGARSISIWNAHGRLVYDSNNDMEEIIAETNPEFFNTTDDEHKFDNRSDDKGPEPEGVTVGEVDGKTYAFVTLERQGGIMTFDVTNPYHPVFVDFVNNRKFDGEPGEGKAGDLAPEDLVFIPAVDSPIGEPLLAVSNEMSGTTTVYQIVK